jgi:CRISPR-associated protein Cas1
MEQGSKVVKISRRLGIEKDEKIVAEIPIFKIDRVFIYGNVQITTQALTFLLSEGIPTAFFYTDGRLKGILEPVKSKNIPLRISQFEKAKDDKFVINFSKTIVRGKLKSQKRLIQRFAKNHPDMHFSEEIRQMDIALSLIERKTGKGGILGVEGIGSATYFKAFKKMIGSWGGFQARVKRPPKDPVNALLSYGYTVLTTEMFFMTYSAGFDPYLGFYHGIRYGRPALALDLIEEFRHVVIDMLVLDMISRKMIDIEDFIEVDEEFRMRRRVLNKFFAQYEKRMNKIFVDPKTKRKSNFRKIMENQVYRLADCITKDTEYVPFFPT